MKQPFQSQSSFPSSTTINKWKPPSHSPKKQKRLSPAKSSASYNEYLIVPWSIAKNASFIVEKYKDTPSFGSGSTGIGLRPVCFPGRKLFPSNSFVEIIRPFIYTKCEGEELNPQTPCPQNHLCGLVSSVGEVSAPKIPLLCFSSLCHTRELHVHLSPCPSTWHMIISLCARSVLTPDC